MQRAATAITSQAAIQQTGNRPVVTRFPAQALETLITSQIHLLLGSPDEYILGLKKGPEKELVVERALDLAKRWTELGISKQHEFVRHILRRVIVGQAAVWAEVDQTKLAEALVGHKLQSSAVAEGRDDAIKLSAKFQSVRRGSELRLMLPDRPGSNPAPIPSLIKAIARARHWYERIVAGEVGTVGELAQTMGLTSTYVKRILQCALLSPPITEMVLSGKQRPHLTLQQFLRDIPIDWREQQNRIFQRP